MLGQVFMTDYKHDFYKMGHESIQVLLYSYTSHYNNFQTLGKIRHMLFIFEASTKSNGKS